MIDKSELLFVVDENNNALLPRTRQEAHANGFWYRTVHVWIINNKKELLCQKRSEFKDLGPGNWECFVGGHINAGDDYITAAVREVGEETGIGIEKEKLTLVKVYKDEISRQFRGIFYYTWNGELDTIVSEAEEVAAVRWMPIHKVRQYLMSPEYTKWYRPGYEAEIFPTLLAA